MHTEVLPSLFPWMRAKTRTISVSTTTSVRIDGAWSEGSRDLHGCVNPETGRPLPMPALTDRFSTTPFDRAQSGGYAATSPGVAFVRHSTFKGKDYVTLELHPDDFQRLVTDKATCTVHEDCRANVELARECAKRGPSLDDRTLKIIGTMRAYKSGDYRKRGLEELKFTTEDADRLIAGGYLTRNKAGAMALTPLGRTVGATVRVY